MKKFLSYILISTVIVANLFAPFSIALNGKGLPGIIKNKTEATTYYGKNIKIKVDSKTDGNLGVLVNGSFVVEKNVEIKSATVVYFIGKEPNNWQKNQVYSEPLDLSSSGDSEAVNTYSIGQQLYQYSDENGNEFDVVKGEKYYAMVAILVPKDNPIDSYVSEPVFFTSGVESNEYALGGGQNEDQAADAADKEIAEGGTIDQAIEAATKAGTTGRSKNTLSDIPKCGTGWITGGGTLGGCVAQILYYLLFSPTSFIFALAGRFFDIVFAYSIQSSSYETTFITQGWGIVRDICNMFFIFVLLYIAFSTILETHGFNTKKTIINVVIIGLFINFSLFAVRLIVDASNIMARVFYRSDAINITLKDGGNFSGLEYKDTGDGIIPMSAAIVNKIDPQSLVLESGKIGNYTTGGEGSESSFNETNKDKISTGTFILMILLSSAINIYGAIIFLSVGLIFVTRVIGLWIAMIISPLAFFSYIVPSLSKQKMIGWEHWWGDTLKLAFLAPIFIFFMYIILQFLDKGLGMFDASKETGLTFILAVIIPFAFIFILLKKAKDIANDMSGEMGQSITKIVAAGGALALGGAALGGAALGRGILGRGMASLSKNEGAMERAKGRIAFNEKLEKWEKDNAAGTATGPKPTWQQYKTDNGIRDNKNPLTWIGSKVNEKQLKIDKISHARHEMDEAKKSAGLEGISDANLSGADEAKIEKNFAKNKNSEVEANVRKGTDGKKDIVLRDSNNDPILDAQRREIKGEEAYKMAKRDEVERAYIANENRNRPQNQQLNSTNLSDKDRKNIENQLNKDFNTALKTTTEQEIKRLFKDIRKESKESIGLGDKLVASSNKGSYDIRNLSKINDKTDKRDGFMSKTGAFLIGSIAAGVRMGFKTSNIDYGVGQKDFMTDLKNTLTDALKNLKVEVPKASSSGGHGGGGGDHGGGGGHH